MPWTRELDHAPILSRSRSASKAVDNFVSIQVEGTQLAKSHPSCTDRWNEDFEISVGKANEVVVLGSLNEENTRPEGWLGIMCKEAAARFHVMRGNARVQLPAQLPMPLIVLTAVFRSKASARSPVGSVVHAARFLDLPDLDTRRHSRNHSWWDSRPSERHIFREV